MLITRAEIGGVGPLDVRVVDGGIVEIERDLSRAAGEPLLDAAGGALLPGLHDHHLHLFALAAANASVRCGPPEVPDRDALAQALVNRGHATEWIRGVGYHESVAGELDRGALDALVPEPPVRIQHRSGALWMLNSAAIDRVGLDRGVDARGVERDEAGRATGRLFRLDEWLRKQLDAVAPPSLAHVSRRLASFGVTGITDATHSNSAAELQAFAAAAERGELLQRVLMLGSAELPQSDHPRIERGALKLLLDERELPSFDEFQRRIEAAHGQQRVVAVHCVTRSELVLALAAFAAAGTHPGDRIEHAAIAPPDALKLVVDLGLTVVTQFGFLRERGDAYLIDVETRDQPWLYRGRGFLEASVPLGRHGRTLRRSRSLALDAGGRRPTQRRGQRARARREAHARAGPGTVHDRSSLTGWSAAYPRGRSAGGSVSAGPALVTGENGALERSRPLRDPRGLGYRFAQPWLSGTK